MPETRQYQGAPGLRPDIWKARGHRSIGFGAVWLVAGIIVSVVTYQQAVAAGGGVYVIAYGPVLYGIYRIIRGIVFLNKHE